MKDGQLKVWWVPQVPMKAFDVLVKDVFSANLLLAVLADYDKFQFDNMVKGDYCNAGGLCIWEEDLEEDDNQEKWTDWYDEETGMGFDEYRSEYLK